MHNYRGKRLKTHKKNYQSGGLQPYTQSNTPAGSITSTGQSSLAQNSQLTPEQIQALAGQFGFRTDSNANLQQDLFSYAQSNNPAALQGVMNRYGQTNAGTFVDNKLGARTLDLLQSLQPPQPTQPAPQRAALTEHYFGPNQHALGMASQKYRDSQSVSDPGVPGFNQNPEYIDFQYYKPNSATIDDTRGRYRVPYDVWSNTITKGTSTISDPSAIDQYAYPSSQATSMRMRGGKVNRQTGGSVPRQQDYPDYQSWEEAMERFYTGPTQQPQINLSNIMPPNSMSEPTPEAPQAPLNPLEEGIQKGIIEPPKGFNSAQDWYKHATTPPDRRRQPGTPKNWRQNLGIGIMAVRTLGSEIAGRVARGRQNDYDMLQQTALGMMNPMPTDDYQPNPYSLYAKYGGKLKNYQTGGISRRPPDPSYVFTRSTKPTKKDSVDYAKHYYDYFHGDPRARFEWDEVAQASPSHTIPAAKWDSIQNMFSAFSNAEDIMYDQGVIDAAIGPNSAGGRAAQATIKKLNLSKRQRGGMTDPRKIYQDRIASLPQPTPSYQGLNSWSGMAPTRDDSVTYANNFSNATAYPNFAGNRIKQALYTQFNAQDPTIQNMASNEAAAYQDALSQQGRAGAAMLLSGSRKPFKFGGLKHVDYFGPPFSNGATYKFSDSEKYDKTIVSRRIVPSLFLRQFINKKKYEEGGEVMAKGGIHIKKENRGKFTEYCGGKVTGDCIQRGLNSPSATIRKRANFARNARKWNK